MLRTAVILSLILSAFLFGERAAQAQPWPGYAGGPQHQALQKYASQFPTTIMWQTPVDLFSTAEYGYLNIHYGSPVITASNTVIVPVKTGESGGFRMEGHNGKTGNLIWQLDSDYTFPPSYDWLLPFQIVLTSGPSVAMARRGRYGHRSRKARSAHRPDPAACLLWD